MMYAPHMNRDTVRAATSRIDARAQVVALKMHPWHFTDARYDARNRWYVSLLRKIDAKERNAPSTVSTVA